MYNYYNIVWGLLINLFLGLDGEAAGGDGPVNDGADDVSALDQIYDKDDDDDFFEDWREEVENWAFIYEYTRE